MLRLATILKVPHTASILCFLLYNFYNFVLTFIITPRWFIGKLLFERQVNQLIASDVFANNAADVPAGMHGNQSRCRPDPQRRNRSYTRSNVGKKARYYYHFDSFGNIFGFHIHQMSRNSFRNKREWSICSISKIYILFKWYIYIISKYQVM